MNQIVEDVEVHTFFMVPGTITGILRIGGLFYDIQDKGSLKEIISMNKDRPKTDYIGDDKVVERLFQRDESGLLAAEAQYRKWLTNFAGRFLTDIRDQEEAVNDTFLKLWENIPPERPRHFPAYLLTLLRNTAIDLLRRKNRKKEVPRELTSSLAELSEVLADNKDTEDLVMARELGRMVSAFLKAQPERVREIFMRRYYGAESVRDIAVKLSVSSSTVEKLLKKTRASLKEYLEKEGFSV